MLVPRREAPGTVYHNEQLRTSLKLTSEIDNGGRTGRKYRERLPVVPESGGGVGNPNLFDAGSLNSTYGAGEQDWG